MNKTFTAALAISAISGLALADHTPATVDTPAAGYADVTVPSGSTAFVLNPFTAFDGALSLGDIEGTSGAKLRVIYSNGKKAFEAEWNPSGSPVGWYVNGVCTNDYAIKRGHSVQFVSDGHTVTMAGVLTNGNASVECVYGHNFIGNVAPVEKPLTSVSISNFDADSGDYVYVGRKLAYYNGNWYDFDAFRSAASVSSLQRITDIQIPAGTGFRVFCAKRYGNKAYPTITLNGSSN